MAETPKKHKWGQGRKVTTRNYPAIVAKIPPELHERIKVDAQHNYTSMNSRIILALKTYYAWLDEEEKGK